MAAGPTPLPSPTSTNRQALIAVIVSARAPTPLPKPQPLPVSRFHRRRCLYPATPETEMTAGLEGANEGAAEVVDSSSFDPASEGEGEEDEEEELELDLSLGSRRIRGSGNGADHSRAAQRRQCCRVLTVEDLSPSLGPRSSPQSSSSALPGGGRGGGGSSGDVPSQPVIGWPPIRAYRMNNLFNQSKDNISDAETGKKKNGSEISLKEGSSSTIKEMKRGHSGSSLFVKVKMDGDPIGRKVDLSVHESYETFAITLEIMFHKPDSVCFKASNGTTRSKLLDGSSDLVLTYEDKDGDWMLVGDVPWGLFVNSVKRLRIMRNSDSNTLAPKFQSFTKAVAPSSTIV